MRRSYRFLPAALVILVALGITATSAFDVRIVPIGAEPKPLKVYRASATLLVDLRPSVVTDRAILDDSLPGDTRTIQQFLASQAVLDRIANTLQLPRTSVAAHALPTYAKNRDGIYDNGDQRAQFLIERQRARYVLQTGPRAENSPLIDVTSRAPSPLLARALINALTPAVNDELKRLGGTDDPRRVRIAVRRVTPVAVRADGVGVAPFAVGVFFASCALGFVLLGLRRRNRILIHTTDRSKSGTQPL